jgi:hypothetical protein
MEINFTNKQISKELFNKTLNNQFSQLALVSQENSGSLFTIDDFFTKYEELFYLIPKQGEINSHEYLINKSAQYIPISIDNSVDVEALLSEITQLRQQVLIQTKLLEEIK